MDAAKVRQSLAWSKYLVLLAAFMVLPVFQSISDGDPEHELSFWISFLAVMWLGVTLIATRRAARLVAAMLAGAAAIGVVSVPVFGLDPAQSKAWWIYFRHGTTLGLLLMLAVLVISDVLRSARIRFDHVCGGLCAFLMVGYAWAVLYSWIERLSPGAFRIDHTAFGIEGIEVAYRQLSVLTYYSFIVLTTTGFGDVTPLSPIARAATVTEAITGQFFLAVLVSRLVSQHLSRSQEVRDTLNTRHESSRQMRAHAPHGLHTISTPGPLESPIDACVRT
jgi:hypothetical protein